MPAQLHISKTPQDVAEQFTNYLVEQIAESDYFSIALSGGSTPKLLFKLWADRYADAIDWSKVHIFWGDERCVAPDHSESNYGLTKELFFDCIDIPEENIHRIHGEADTDEEAVRYSEEIQDNTVGANDYPSFDLVMLGMGGDGHTASIFPHQMELLTDERVAVPAVHPESGQRRVSLSGTLINNAQRVAFLVTGAGKKEKVHAILKKQEGYEAFPAAHIKPMTGELHWFMDEAAWGE